MVDAPRMIINDIPKHNYSGNFYRIYNQYIKNDIEFKEGNNLNVWFEIIWTYVVRVLATEGLITILPGQSIMESGFIRDFFATRGSSRSVQQILNNIPIKSSDAPQCPVMRRKKGDIQCNRKCGNDEGSVPEVLRRKDGLLKLRELLDSGVDPRTISLYLFLDSCPTRAHLTESMKDYLSFPSTNVMDRLIVQIEAMSVSLKNIANNLSSEGHIAAGDLHDISRQMGGMRAEMGGSGGGSE